VGQSWRAPKDHADILIEAEYYKQRMQQERDKQQKRMRETVNHADCQKSLIWRCPVLVAPFFRADTLISPAIMPTQLDLIPGRACDEEAKSATEWKPARVRRPYRHRRAG